MKITRNSKGQFIKGQISPKGMLGKKHSLETRNKMSKVHRGKKMQPFSEEHKLKLSSSHKGKPSSRKGIKLSEETKLKISKSKKGRKISEETKRKMRNSAFEYAKKIVDILCPRIGKNEKEILDKLEQELHHKILRQFKVSGYFLDGYIPELNLAVEIDEKPKDKNKDIERERVVTKELKCKFLRIKDYD